MSDTSLPPSQPFSSAVPVILDALGVNDDKAGFLGPTIALSHRANHIFYGLPKEAEAVLLRFTPLLEIAVVGTPLGLVLRQHLPLAAAFEHIGHAAEDFV